MANVSRINGFKPVKHIDGSPFNGQLTTYYVPASDATAIGIGDLVSFAANSDVNGVRAVTKTAVGGASIGAVVGVNFNPLNLNLPEYRQASVAGYVLVSDAPDVVYEAQANGVIGATNFGKNANHVDAGITTATGFSGEQVDQTTVATTATLTLKLVGAKVSPDNDPTLTAAKVYVIINNHQLSGGTGTAGV